MRDYCVVLAWQVFIRYLLQRRESYQVIYLLPKDVASDTLNPSKDSGRLKIYEDISGNREYATAAMQLRRRRRKKRRPAKKVDLPDMEHVSHATTPTRWKSRDLAVAHHKLNAQVEDAHYV